MQEDLHNVRPGNVLELAVTRDGGEKRGGEETCFFNRWEPNIFGVVALSHLLSTSWASALHV